MRSAKTIENTGESLSSAVSRANVEIAGLQDADEVARIYNEYVGLPLATMDSSPWSTEAVKNWMAALEERECLLVLRSQPSSIHGWGTLKSYSTRAGYRTTCEISLYLDPEDCGKGFGDFLMSALIKHGQEAGVHHIVAKNLASNSRSRGFHEAHGFELVGIQKEVGLIDGDWQDVAIYQLILPRR